MFGALYYNTHIKNSSSLYTRSHINVYDEIFSEMNSLFERRINAKFVRSFLDVIVMAILNSAPAYGYEIMSTVHKEFGVLLSPGTLYPLLHSLEDRELIVSSLNGGKIVYTTSSKGRQKFKETLRAFSLTLDEMLTFMKERNKEIVIKV